jgi:hypothetical protein
MNPTARERLVAELLGKSACLEHVAVVNVPDADLYSMNGSLTQPGELVYPSHHSGVSGLGIIAVGARQEADRTRLGDSPIQIPSELGFLLLQKDTQPYPKPITRGCSRMQYNSISHTAVPPNLVSLSRMTLSHFRNRIRALWVLHRIPERVQDRIGY